MQSLQTGFFNSFRWISWTRIELLSIQILRLFPSPVIRFLRWIFVVHRSWRKAPLKLVSNFSLETLESRLSISHIDKSGRVICSRRISCNFFTNSYKGTLWVSLSLNLVNTWETTSSRFQVSRSTAKRTNQTESRAGEVYFKLYNPKLNFLKIK